MLKLSLTALSLTALALAALAVPAPGRADDRASATACAAVGHALFNQASTRLDIMAATDMSAFSDDARLKARNDMQTLRDYMASAREDYLPYYADAAAPSAETIASEQAKPFSVLVDESTDCISDLYSARTVNASLKP